MIVYYTEEDIARVIDAVDDHTNVVRRENRIDEPFYDGTRDFLINLDVDGHIFELQVKLTGILEVSIRYDAHKCYEFFRKYFAGEAEANGNFRRAWRSFSEQRYHYRCGPDDSEGKKCREAILFS